MSATLITYASVSATLAYPIEQIWSQVAEFGDIDRWIAGVTACTMEGHGPGAIRTVSLGGYTVRERLELIDPTAHRIRYQVLPPHSVPASNVHGELTLRALDASTTHILWQSHATDFEAPPTEIGARIEQFYRASLTGLETLLANT